MPVHRVDVAHEAHPRDDRVLGDERDQQLRYRLQRRLGEPAVPGHGADLHDLRGDLLQAAVDRLDERGHLRGQLGSGPP
ncbi:MAG: hypothetical protein AVDCRST_MAG36-70 [uncultured Nocardioidaceae bacterium]|uniref:Uncharacterized protein n=1 Tax=uncultured Nocardioidaceae bacterium TaxID=253824 RepID=A0A6J4KUI6_9ACTN|nr:MAG: hypothetical protein AVDCRST_MAG36-70 [uncultured Nocardioidaceae bacterium]